MVARELSNPDVTHLIEQNLHIARSVAFRLKQRFPWVDMDDIRSYSQWGLTRAASLYSPAMGTPFVRFATQKAFYLGIDAMREDKVVRRSPKAQAQTLGSSAGRKSISANLPLLARVADERAGNAVRLLELREELASLLGRLRDKDRQLMLLYYSSGMTFKEIAMVFGRSESAICLRHGVLIAKLRRFAGVS
ncbi:MAG: sigma-70 family RNA polymerase sigma factor [Phycisphaerae bacterium]|jgi:RNA polymerase sigma factor (sigma-70 family)|nr:sigma-70 family RNA polymerase sigma factor [Phycisphaerae bacterium]